MSRWYWVSQILWNWDDWFSARKLQKYRILMSESHRSQDQRPWKHTGAWTSLANSFSITNPSNLPFHSPAFAPLANFASNDYGLAHPLSKICVRQTLQIGNRLAKANLQIQTVNHANIPARKKPLRSVKFFNESICWPVNTRKGMEPVYLESLCWITSTASGYLISMKLGGVEFSTA